MVQIIGVTSTALEVSSDLIPGFSCQGGPGVPCGAGYYNDGT